jgi:ribulose-phosphate 3-epimerase
MEISLSLDPSLPNDLKGYLAEVNNFRDVAVHCDVMDGVFVERSAVDSDDFKYIVKNATQPVDVHLMVLDIRAWLLNFPWINGVCVRSLTFHVETQDQADTLVYLWQVKAKGIQCGVVIDLDTPSKPYKAAIEASDCVVIMSVKAGASGQTFNEKALCKVAEIRAINKAVRIILDGGVNAENIGSVQRAGVDTVVIGSALYKAKNRTKELEKIKKTLKKVR